VLAFIPQFVSAARGSVSLQMLAFGAIVAVLTAIIFSVLGRYAAGLSGWLAHRPRTTTWLNFGAGATFIASGVSILALGNRC
jgi:threonine/homoserine/homoserine lactone efflux protein